MKRSLLIFLGTLTILVVFCTLPSNNNQTINLENHWDTVRPLANPDKGWYHHMLDNGIDKYLIQDENDLYNFPGMDHLYLRLAWAYLEPEEGEYNWSYIDDIVEKYVPKGYGISFRISCKETGSAPGSVPVEIDGVGYATPYWVKEAGAKGVIPSEFGPPIWTPVWDDPVYLEKLDNFHKAFAERYDGKPYVRYIDVGSIGEWGEGNAHRSTNIPPTVGEVKASIDIYLKHYKKSQIVVTDDLIYWRKPEEDVKELFDYAVSKGITFRDDSPLVEYYMQKYLDTWTVSHPHFFEAVYKTKPTVFELQHYHAVKEDGNWLGKNGTNIIPDYGVSGAEVFIQSMKLIRPTYIGFHGYLGAWLEDNPELTNELLNLSGYWYFPKSIKIIKAKGETLSFSVDWQNKGVAPAYNTYMLKGKLVNIDYPSEIIEFKIDDSGNIRWMPGKVFNEMYYAELDKDLKGSYSLFVQLFDKKSDRVVDLGLKESIKDNDGYFKIGDIEQ